jgi:hypothetical protein
MARVYWNRNRLVWSIKDGDRPVVHARALVMEDVTFKVWLGVRAAALAKHGRRNVHAFAVGRVLPWCDPSVLDWQRMVAVTYNPFRADHFHRKDNARRVDACRRAYLFASGHLWAVGIH